MAPHHAGLQALLKGMLKCVYTFAGPVVLGCWVILVDCRRIQCSSPLHGEITDDASYTTPAESEAVYYSQNPMALEAVTQ